jgi:aldehyde dehydrogenase (NAD+)
VRDPLGVCLIIAPWNYPLQLLLSPLIGCIAGGNCALLKPSELAPHTAAVIAALIREHFPAHYINVVQGEGSELIPALMRSFRFDHLFFTGGTATGRAIALQAAEQLVPVTLELGGKSPCIVDTNVNLETAAARIVWGTFTNAGQTCIAPDYVLVHEDRKAALLQAMQAAIRRFYGADPRTSRDYGRIITAKRFDTLCRFLQQGTIVTGGQTDAAERYIAPTILDDVSVDQPVMQEEIFGPILPVFSYRTHEEAIAFIQRHPHPLALYIFSSNRKVQDLYSQLLFGGACINNTLLHVGNMRLPFGGVGYSGMGQYHGRFSFDTFTRPKAILQTAAWIDPAVKYPPYQGKLKWLKWFFT